MILYSDIGVIKSHWGGGGARIQRSFNLCVNPPVIHCWPLQGSSFVLFFFVCQGFGDVTPYVCACFIFSSGWVAEWPSFGKKLHTRLTICSSCNCSYFPFWF